MVCLVIVIIAGIAIPTICHRRQVEKMEQQQIETAKQQLKKHSMKIEPAEYETTYRIMHLASTPTSTPTPTPKPVSELEKKFNRYGLTLEGGAKIVPPAAK